MNATLSSFEFPDRRRAFEASMPLVFEVFALPHVQDKGRPKTGDASGSWFSDAGIDDAIGALFKQVAP
jgi:hypothetical protein